MIGCPPRRWIRSPNGVYQVHIALGESLGELVGFKGAKRGRHAQAILTGPDGERHVFSLLNPVAPVDAALFNDGTLLALDNWHNMGYGAVLAAYSKSGAVLWSKRLEEALPADVLARVPISVSSRWWRRQPFEWTAEADEAGDAWILITLWNEDRLRVRLKDGRARYVQVRDLGDQPERLLQRGRDLAERNDLKGAAEALRRAISLNPGLIDAYRGLSSIHQRLDDHQAAVDVLSQGVQVNPAQNVKPSAGGYQDNVRLGLVLNLARAYREAGRPRDAELTYQECLRLDPGFWLAGQGLAGLWLVGAGDEEADRLLTDFFEVLRGDPEHWMAAANLTRAAREIGDVYRNHRRDDRARGFYERAFRRGGELDPFLARDLAEVLERLGEAEEALSVFLQLRDWLAGWSGYQHDLQQVEGEIRRLAANQPQKSLPR